MYDVKGLESTKGYNDRTVIAAHRVQRTGYNHLQYVLCYVPEGGDEAYVTWMVNLGTGGMGLGHKFAFSDYGIDGQAAALEAAIGDFTARICRDERIGIAI